MRNNNFIPVRQGPFNGELQTLEHWELFGFWVASVAGVVDNGVVVRVVLFHWWWGHVEAAAPDLDLIKYINNYGNVFLIFVYTISVTRLVFMLPELHRTLRPSQPC